MENSTQTPQDLSIRTQPQQQEDATPASAPLKPKSKPPPKIHTYHCLCTHLLIASTHNLTTLPRRHAPGLDTALILPLPAPPSPPSSSSSSSSSSCSDSETVHKAAKKPRTQKKKKSYTLLLNASQDRKPHVIARADGFEKRYLWRCARCRLIVGYRLDDVHFPAGGEREVRGGGGGGDDEEGGGGLKGRGRVLYLLPGGLMTTEEMAAGKAWGDREIELGGGEE